MFSQITSKFLYVTCCAIPFLSSGYTPHSWPWSFYPASQFLLPCSIATLWGSIRTDDWGVLADSCPFLERRNLSYKPLSRCCHRASLETCASVAVGFSLEVVALLPAPACCPRQLSCLCSIYPCVIIFHSLLKETVYHLIMNTEKQVNVIHFGICSYCG